MLDPQIYRCLTLAFALLFILAALHKIGDRARLVAVLSDYRIVPAALLPAVTLALPALEMVTGCLWIAATFSQQVALLPVVAAALLLTVYALAIFINLIRGRTHIDCGCSFSGTAAESGSRQQISPAMVLRNLLLLAIALLPLMGTTGRELTVIDHGVLVLALPTIVLSYASLNQLLGNRGAIVSWRGARG